MRRTAADPLEGRVLVVAPTTRDATTTQALLASASVAAEVCSTFDGLLDELDRGAAAVMVPEEVLAVGTASRRLEGYVKNQPPWSDLPLLVLVRPGARSAGAAEAVRTLGNVTLLERPVRMTTLLSAVRTALRARDRQLQIRQLLRERAEAERALRLSDRRKDEFLATLSHELRNPLAPLVTGLHLLKASGVRDPRVLDVTPVMERQLQHLIRLVDDLLEISRITRGLVNIEREPLDLVVVVGAAIETCRPVLDTAGHTLVADLPDAPVPVTGDAVRLTQVFSNLLTNAAKYTNANGTIRVTVSTTEQRAAVSVRDNGIGIAPAQLDSVFDMFMQVDRSDRRAQGGLGIGLTLVRSLVTMHGGHVEARSDGVGAGSEFIVTLPLRETGIASARAPAELAPFPPRRLLLVDDNHDAADTLGTLLAALGMTVTVAHGGQEALDRLREFRPDAILLDIGMPGMDGYAVARRIRRLPGFEAVTLIALTGWGQDQDVRSARDAGFDHHLVKPPDMDKLRRLLLAGNTGQ